MDWLERNWRAHAGRIGISGLYVDACWALLSSMYYGRAYHNLHHVGDCVSLLHTLSRAGIQYALEVETALWFHDVVYDPRSSDNERRSALIAECCLIGAGLRPSYVDRVSQAIEATRHLPEVPPHAYQRVIVDIDLSGLASERETYIGNSRRIRHECAHLSGTEWRDKRHKWLTDMLARPRIFVSGLFEQDWEKIARANMQAEIDWLETRKLALIP